MFMFLSIPGSIGFLSFLKYDIRKQQQGSTERIKKIILLFYQNDVIGICYKKLKDSVLLLGKVIFLKLQNLETKTQIRKGYFWESILRSLTGVR